MKKSSSARFNIKDLFVIFLSLFFSMLFGFSAYRIIKAKKSVTQISSEAVVKVQERNSQKADLNKTNWVKVNETTVFNAGDFLTVDPMAMTRLEFTDGTKITVLENSTIQLLPDLQENFVKLIQRGKLIVDTTSGSRPVVIKSLNDSLIKIDVNSLVEICAVDAHVDASIIKGKGIVISTDGVEKTVPQESGFILLEENAMQRKPLVVLSPCIYSSVSAAGKKGIINFEWSKNNASIQFVKILINHDANLKTQVTEFLQDADDSKFAVTLDPGIWYWRVIPVASTGEEMESENFTLQGKFHIK